MAVPPSNDHAGSGGARVPISEAARLLGVPMPTLRSWEIPVRHSRLRPIRRQAPQLLRAGAARAADDAGRDRPRPAGRPRRPVRPGNARHPGVGARFHRFAAAGLRSGRRRRPAGGTQPGGGAAGPRRLHRRRAVPGDEADRVVVAERSLRRRAGTVHHRDGARLAGRAGRARSGADRTADPVVLACGPSDQHTIGLEALALLLRLRQRPCRVLGARVAAAGPGHRGPGQQRVGGRHRLPPQLRPAAGDPDHPGGQRAADRGVLRRQRLQLTAQSA